jgi:hypothetical protein
VLDALLFTVDSTDHVEVIVELSDVIAVSFFLLDRRIDFSGAFDVGAAVISAALTLLTRLLHPLLLGLIAQVASPGLFRAEDIAPSAVDVAGAGAV